MEQELKLRLPTRGDYERLQDLLGRPDRRLEQHNAYLDTAGAELRARRVMARLRDENGALLLTVKWKAGHADGYFQAEEEEVRLEAPSAAQAVETGEAARVLRDLCPELQNLELAGLRVLGGIRNLRQSFRLDGFELELDHSTYPDGAEDFELELETNRPEAAWKLLERLLRDSGARGEPQTQTKYERFLKSIPST
jgi:uncharacterized protein YjbK